MSTVEISFSRGAGSFSDDGWVYWQWRCLCGHVGGASDVVIKAGAINAPPPPCEVECYQCGIRFRQVGYRYTDPIRVVGQYSLEDMNA